TDAEAELQDEDVIAYAQIADRLLRLPVVYLEYSGRFGDPDLVNRAGEMLTQARLFYGGGGDRADRAAQVARAADTVIVGNIIYENMEKALETVAAVKPERKDR